MLFAKQELVYASSGPEYWTLLFLFSFRLLTPQKDPDPFPHTPERSSLSMISILWHVEPFMIDNMRYRFAIKRL